MANAQLHDVFVDLLDGLQTGSAQMHLADTGQAQRAWMTPAGWDGDPFAIATVHLPAFDREPINQNYQEVHSGEDGRIGAAASLKIQLDYVAVMERAFRSRHAGPIRGQMHAAARHAGQGHVKGIFPRTRDYAQDLLKSAGGST